MLSLISRYARIELITISEQTCRIDVYYTSVIIRQEYVITQLRQGLPYQVIVRPRGVEEVEVAGSVAVDGDERAA